MIVFPDTLSPHCCSPYHPCNVPPHPSLIDDLIARYLELIGSKRIPESMTFEQFFDFWVSKRRGENLPGMDDGVIRTSVDPESPQFISRPPKKLQGKIRTMVLLVDFDDQPAQTTSTVGRFERMLFGVGGSFPSGSMRDYFQTISNFDGATNQGIDVVGEVHGWFRMPKPLSYYSNGGSGTLDTYPRNSQGLAKDAIHAAVNEGVEFSGYDVFEEGMITALFIIHAGRGAELTGNSNDIWSHKWQIPNNGAPTNTPGLVAKAYLTVPEDCRVGVCAHEWGHLAARWADFYDTGKVSKSNGLGEYCLMASGSWCNSGNTPTLPNGMLRMFHDWIDVQLIDRTTTNVTLRAAVDRGGVAIIQNPDTMSESQYFVVEYRRRTGQDRYLPDEGIAVYVVDESIDNVNDEQNLAIELFQADGARHLQRFGRFGNRGDENDLFPSGNKRTLSKTTTPALKIPDGTWPKVAIRIKGQPGDETMSFDVEFR